MNNVEIKNENFIIPTIYDLDEIKDEIMNKVVEKLGVIFEEKNQIIKVINFSSGQQILEIVNKGENDEVFLILKQILKNYFKGKKTEIDKKVDQKNFYPKLNKLNDDDSLNDFKEYFDKKKVIEILFK
jgi:hypothetical protein